MAGGQSAGVYSLPPSRFYGEDILFCVDVDAESRTEMKLSGPKGRPITRLDSIKQGLLLFVNAKLSINPDHRFAFAVLGQSVSWDLYQVMHAILGSFEMDQSQVPTITPVLPPLETLCNFVFHDHQIFKIDLRKELSNEVESAIAAVRGLAAANSSYGLADITQLFRIAAHEAKKSRMQGRLFRVVLIYCRSSVRPQHQWPVSQKVFTMDVIYLHDKPTPENCPQKVYDALVDAVEHVSEYEGYIFESGQGLARVLFRHMCMLLSHPQQRCVEDDLDIPRSLTRKSPTPTDAIPNDDSISVSSQ